MAIILLKTDDFVTQTIRKRSSMVCMDLTTRRRPPAIGHRLSIGCHTMREFSTVFSLSTDIRLIFDLFWPYVIWHSDR